MTSTAHRVTSEEYTHTMLIAFTGRDAVERHLREDHGLEPASNARERAGQHLDAHDIPRDAVLSYRSLADEQAAKRLSPLLPVAAAAAKPAASSVAGIAPVAERAAAAAGTFAASMRGAVERQERDAFWNHPGSV